MATKNDQEKFINQINDINYLVVDNDKYADKLSAYSRFPIVKQIPFENLVGKARFIFFSLENSRFLEIWKWPKAIRGSRIFSAIK